MDDSEQGNLPVDTHSFGDVVCDQDKTQTFTQSDKVLSCLCPVGPFSQFWLCVWQGQASNPGGFHPPRRSHLHVNSK